MEIILLTIGVVGAVMLAMSVGVIFSNRCLRGSCGGPEVLGPDGDPLGCGACPRRRSAHAPDPGRPAHGSLATMPGRADARDSRLSRRPS